MMQTSLGNPPAVQYREYHLEPYRHPVGEAEAVDEGLVYYPREDKPGGKADDSHPKKHDRGFGPAKGRDIGNQERAIDQETVQTAC